MNRQHRLSILVSLVWTLGYLGCGGGGPSSPDSEPLGATLRGRLQQSGVSVVSGQTQRAFSTASDAVEVVVSQGGVEIARIPIVNGAFTLRGLPESFTLVFLDASGAAIGDPIEFDGVKPNQEIDIVVAVENGEIVIVEERRTGIDHDGSTGIEIEGTAQSITIDDATRMTGALTVNSHHVLTRAGETSIRKGNRSLTLDDLHDGDRVHVRGVFEGSDVFAQEIKLQEELPDQDSGGATCNVPDPAKPNHILICHKGKTKSVSPDAWPGHRGHGDTCGPC